MTELSRQILESYQVRKTRKQKTAFIALLQQRFPQLKVEKRGLFGSRNLVLGDVDSAKAVLTAHYDTCPMLLVPNFCTPKRPILAIGYSLLIALPILLLMGLCTWLLNALLPDPMWVYWCTLAVYLGFIILLLGGPANRHTANDNTSGVITLVEMYTSLTPEQRKQVCLVFFDNEEQGLIGSGQFRGKYKKQMKDKLLINFDCVSDGDHILIAPSKKANRKYHVALAQAFRPEGEKQILLEKLEKVYYPSDQAGFPMAVAVAAMNYKKPFGYYLGRIHTKRDTVFDERNIDYLVRHTGMLLERM